MNRDEARKHFAERGFAAFPGVLSTDEVARLRAFFEQLFAEPPRHKGDRQEIRHDVFSRYPETRFVLSSAKFLDAVRTIVGDSPVAIPEMAVHDSGFGGWHKDTASLDLAGMTWHRDPDFRMVQAALYLQPNSEYGGGLDIVPGSHEDPAPGGGGIGGALRRSAKLGRAALGGRKPYTIPSQAGDMVLFDMRADHRATPPTACGPDEVPEEHRKFALFSVWSATEKHAALYRKHIASRKGYDYLEGHAYPNEVRDLSRENEFALA